MFEDPHDPVSDYKMYPAGGGRESFGLKATLGASAAVLARGNESQWDVEKTE